MLRAQFTRVETITDQPRSRIGWVDVANGFCIILVVLMHATLGVEKANAATTALQGLVEWAKPFLMPALYFLSGLFLTKRINKPWRSYLDTQVYSFAYLYVLWLTILVAMRAGGLVDDSGLASAATFYVSSLIEPDSTLRFVYLLAVFCLAAKLTHRLPSAVVLIAATALNLFLSNTGWPVLDEFANEFVFFYAGYALAPAALAYADRLETGRFAPVAMAIVLWAVANAYAVADSVVAIPGLNLFFSSIGIIAVITSSVLMDKTPIGTVLRQCGRNAIAIYLASGVFVAVAQTIMLKLALAPEFVVIACAVAGVVGSLALERAVRGNRLSFMFVMPEALRRAPKPNNSTRPVPLRRATTA